MTSLSASVGDRHSLLCPICANVFENPKLLPCHHTLCEVCIEVLASNYPDGPFPCPICRAPTRLPNDGAAALQANFYISEEELDRARMGYFRCTTHPDQTVDVFCTQCSILICAKCALFQHKQHDPQDLREVADRFRKELESRKLALSRNLKYAQNKLMKINLKQKNLSQKKEAIRTNIFHRHQVVVALANKQRDDALGSLDHACLDTENQLESLFSEWRNHVENIKLLINRVQATLCNGRDNSVVHAGIHLGGSSSEESLERMYEAQNKRVCHPVLRYSSEVGEISQCIVNYVGVVASLEVEKCAPDMSTVTPTNIPPEPGTEVFSLCITDNIMVSMSYSWRDESDKACGEQYNSRSGQIEGKPPVGKGKTTYYSLGPKTMHYHQGERKFITFAKSPYRIVSLHNKLQGTASIVKSTVTNKDPLVCKQEIIMKIGIGYHRAFDVDRSGTLFVVVEQRHDPSTNRTVNFYKSGQGIGDTESSEIPEISFAAASYHSSIRPFLPSDVCFTSDGMLLVADEINDAIHMVRTSPLTSLSLVRYVALGHPFLVQPLALAVDLHDQVWVACRGRIVFRLQPDTSYVKPVWLT